MAVIEVNHVAKEFQLGQLRNLKQTALDVIARLRGHDVAERAPFKALDDVDFKVELGEVLGIIGHNGAGKSTLLKMLSHITAPSSGEIIIRGNLSALIEISTGFHPELTGRENVYLNGVIFGMSRKEIGEKLPGIIEFSGIGDFIDAPVKRYSSGMYLRLGFAIAAHLDPDILLLDEVLAVGDVAFQWKCLDRIERLRKAGRTIVLVSHDLAAIERLCDRAILLSRGQIVCEGRPSVVTAEYQRSTLLISDPPAYSAAVSRRVECTKFSYRGETGAEDGSVRTGSVRTGDSMVVRLDYNAHAAVDNVIFNVYLYWPSGYLCAQLGTGGGTSVPKGPGYIELLCPFVNLRPGLYLVDVSAERPPEVIDWQHRCAILRIDVGPLVLGDLHMPHEARLVEHGRVCRLGEAGYPHATTTTA
jgi:ABC-type polysaccharide/polyol phosphate transport system ATPase subunit